MMVAVRNYVLIDYENVQPKTLAALEGPDFHVLVFVGVAQAKISIDVAEALQALGPSARYIRCSGGGSNALDFHIAFYIGELASNQQECFFHVVSKDTGFDPLMAHLRARGLRVSRSTSIETLPMFRAADVQAAKAEAVQQGSKSKPVALEPSQRLDWVVSQLGKHAKNRPASPKTLGNAIGAMFQNTLKPAELAALIQQLQQRKWVSIKDKKVTYALPG